MIVGAGIAGLTAGWMLRDRKILVLEATDRVGGRMRSEPRGPYWLNLGAHLFGGPGTLIDRLVKDTELETRLIPGDRMGLAFRRPDRGPRPPGDVPFRLPLSWAARLSFVRAGLRLRTAAREHVRAARPSSGDALRPGRARVLAHRDDQTFAAYLGELHPDVAAIFRAISSGSRPSPSRSRPAAAPPLSRSCGATTRPARPAT